MADILAEILANKRLEVAAARRARPLAQVQEAAAKAPPARGMVAALSPTQAPRIIAECKRQSPSRGVMVADYDPVKLARAYEKGGAAAISVLTDERYFGGTLADLTAVRQAVGLPVMRKDFIVDEYQIHEARAAGADSFLLLSGPLLSPAEIDAFLKVGRQLGMEPLVESHTDAELAAALTTDARIFGVNNRNLKDFSIDLAIARDLVAGARAKKPEGLMVCESGIHSAHDVEVMCTAGYNVFLVGEALATSADPAAALAGLLGKT